MSRLQFRVIIEADESRNVGPNDQARALARCLDATATRDVFEAAGFGRLSFRIEAVDAADDSPVLPSVRPPAPACTISRDGDPRPKLDIVPPAERTKAARSEETVELLRLMLADAEAGHIAGVMVIVEHPECEHLSHHCSRIPDRWSFAGKLEWLKLQLLKDEEG